MPPFNERRLFPRYPTIGLKVEIDGRLFDVADISLEGVRVKGPGLVIGNSVTLLLYPAGKDRRKGVLVGAKVVVRHRDSVALRFDGATMALMKLVVHQASLHLGVEPYAVK
ncbi:PilZ domain-containing protein [Telmatospirillum siberiense]|uniref:PilZ domain-containing protein n=1 Tax=Telmatospirillum siberiense TaxID=382514 RepID=A0A2N3PXZ8_9PROT|nr:PilZ domain-containing protein [Telmatospirillum siberiense]PKU25245.1 hypothetical protein CWS72_06465 [Telmatospirillum siberiense]